VEFFEDRIARRSTSGVEVVPVLRGLAKQFANNLPGVITATMITEVVLVWPGEAMLFVRSVAWPEEAPLAASFLLLSALCVLAVRFGVELFVRSDLEATGSHV